MNEHNVQIFSSVKRRRARQRRYRQAHRDQIAAKKSCEYQANRSRVLQSRRLHYAAHCEELKAARRSRFAKKQQREFERRKRARYLWEHPDTSAKLYDATMRRKKRLEFQRSPEGSAALREDTFRRLRRIQRRSAGMIQ